MKHAPYMASAETREYMWLSAVVQMMDKLLETTQDKNWRRKFKTIQTMTSNVVAERWKDIDELEKSKLARRIKSIGIKVYSYDDARVDSSDDVRVKTISQEDFLDLCDSALLNCYGCGQGDVVKECPRRKLFHRIGMQVYASRENPAPGECEFRYENSVRLVTPQYKAVGDGELDILP